MSKIEEDEQWKTKRERLFDYLDRIEGEIQLETIKLDLEYADLKSLLSDFNMILRSLKKNRKKVMVKPSKCINCGYQFRLRSGSLKIPSKCPKCHGERIEWPLIKIHCKKSFL